MASRTGDLPHATGSTGTEDESALQARFSQQAAPLGAKLESVKGDNNDIFSPAARTVSCKDYVPNDDDGVFRAGNQTAMGNVRNSSTILMGPEDEPLPDDQFDDLPAEKEAEENFNSIGRGTPGEKVSSNTSPESPHTAEMQRGKSRFFADAFAYREPVGRMMRTGSVIIASLRINVLIQNESEFVRSFSAFLTHRYQQSCPQNSVLMTVNSLSMTFRGSPLPAYLLKITAIPSLVQPTLNKRNALLIQKHLQELLHIHPGQGIVLFNPIGEANIATCGTTFLGEMELMNKGTARTRRDIQEGRTTGSTQSRNPHGETHELSDTAPSTVVTSAAWHDSPLISDPGRDSSLPGFQLLHATSARSVMNPKTTAPAGPLQDLRSGNDGKWVVRGPEEKKPSRKHSIMKLFGRKEVSGLPSRGATRLT